MAKFNAFTRGVEIADSFRCGNLSWCVEAIKRYPPKRRAVVVKFMREWMKHDHGEFDRFKRLFVTKYPRTNLE